MKLTGIEMRREQYGEDKGKFKGHLTFNDDYQNRIQLVLDEEKCQAILILVADQLVKQTQQIAGDMTARIIEQATSNNLLLDKSEVVG